MRYIIQITTDDNQHYQGCIHQGNPHLATPITAPLKIGPGDTVAIGGQSVRLSDVVSAFVERRTAAMPILTDERALLQLGQYLYQQLFGTHPPSSYTSPRDSVVDLRIIPGDNDEHSACLPWVLLAHNGIFLSAAGWSVSLCRDTPHTEVTLPPSPRMLVAMPEPRGPSAWEETYAQSHLEELQTRLAAYGHSHLSLGDALCCVSTWDEFTQQLRTFKPHIVYYYGHGSGNRDTARLIFADSTQQANEVPIADVAQCLRSLPEAERPHIVYLNCCSGDAGGVLGAGWQLAFVPAVVTNRTLAHIDAARAQGVAFWQGVLLEALPPHIVMANLYSRLVDLGLSFRDARWMTPVIHSHYDAWQATPPQRLDPLEHDPHWHLKLDRVSQFATVAFQTRQMVREQRPRVLAYTWYGQKGQGIETFHRRLRVELEHDLGSNTFMKEVSPEWPMEYANPERSFADMLCEAFDVQSLRQIPAALRGVTRGATGRQVLVYVRHAPVRSKAVMNPALLKRYLTWWDTELAPLLERHTHILLTVSFEVENAPKFRRVMMENEDMYGLHLTHITYRLLDEMERVGLKDLYEFLQTHNIRLPQSRREQMLQRILEETGGHYDLTVAALRALVNRALDESEDTTTASDDDDMYDY